MTKTQAEIASALHRLWSVAEQARKRAPLSRDDDAFVRDVLPDVGNSIFRRKRVGETGSAGRSEPPVAIRETA